MSLRTLTRPGAARLLCALLLLVGGGASTGAGSAMGGATWASGRRGLASATESTRSAVITWLPP